MRRLIITAMAAAVMCALSHIPVLAMDWSRAFEKARYSVVSLWHNGGSCTAFSINYTQNYYLTADHCINEDGSMALWKEAVPNFNIKGKIDVLQVVKRNGPLDLALLQGGLGLPALAPGDEPRRGHELASIGYAFGEPEPFIFSSIVAAIKNAKAYSTTRRIILKDNQDMGGMSGGPVVDKHVNVVAMVQQALRVDGHVTNVAYGTSIRQIREFAKGYWDF